jgi:DnaK suppressor protein
MPKATKKAASTKAGSSKAASGKSTAAKAATTKKAAPSKAKAGATKAAPARKPAPAKSAPAKSAPVKSAPVKSAPTRSAPAKAATGKAAAAKPASAKATARQAAPAKSAPAKATTRKAAPARAAAPAKSAPARATATRAVPARASSTEFKNFEPYQTRRGEVYMNEPQRDHFKAILLNWKAELMQEVDRTVNHMKDEAANFPDPADRATQEEEFSLELRTRDRERKLIKKIDSTIERIEQDDYGYCDACGVEIGIQRLEARPTASLCIDCKTLAEIKEKQELG